MLQDVYETNNCVNEALFEEALTSTKAELGVSPNNGISALFEASMTSLIEFKDEIMGITRDDREDATTSISEDSYPIIE